jgi:plastocyanin
MSKNRREFLVAGAGAAMVACGGGIESGKEASKQAPEAAVVYTKVDPATAAKVTGKALYSGPKPVRKVIDMSSEETECKRSHKGPVQSEEVMLNKDGSLANVFVYISAGLEGKKFEPPKTPVKIDQKGCMFAPHVAGVMTGQPLLVSNSDPVTHNVHPIPEKNREWNQGQPPGAPEIERTFRVEEIMIPVKCNVHSWMRSYICVVAHPYFAVTGEGGTFELAGLPPGEYTITAWHEKFGKQEAKVTLAASGAGTAEFTFKV